MENGRHPKPRQRPEVHRQNSDDGVKAPGRGTKRVASGNRADTAETKGSTDPLAGVEDNKGTASLGKRLKRETKKEPTEAGGSLIQVQSASCGV